MLKNYLKIALRNLGKQKLYSAINILGLALGLAFCVLVLLFVNDELTYDRFHADSDRIYRLYRQPLDSEASFDKELYMPLPTGAAFKTDFAAVEEYVRFIPFGTNTVRHENGLSEQDGVVFADPSVFSVFSFPLRTGDSQSALADRNAVVLTPESAQRYFGAENPMGRTLSVRIAGAYRELTVTGVTEDVPSNSTIQFQMLLNTRLLLDVHDAYGRVEDQWDATRCITYIKLREGSSIADVKSGLIPFMENHLGFIFREMYEAGRSETAEPTMVYEPQPLADIHLNPDIPGGFTAPSSPRNSYILGGIALAVLVIACINFMILAIGRSARRAKEVGLRKVAGAGRRELMMQFWGEALLLTFVAFALGIGLAEALLPVFSELAGKELTLLTAFQNTTAMAALAGLFLLTGVVAGSYPALVLSRFKPVDSLKEKIAAGGSNLFTRSLIVVQFGLSVFLVTGTLIMSNQLEYMRQKNLGYQGEQVVVIPTRGLDGERVLDIFRDRLSSEPDIQSIAGISVAFDQGTARRGFDYNGQLKQVVVFQVTSNLMETLQMDLVRGRNFNPNLASDSTSSIIVNQAFVEEFGWTENPTERELQIDWGSLVNPRAIGVVGDFNFQSLRNSVQSAMLYISPRDGIRNLMVRISPDDMSGSVEKLRATWSTLTDEIPFSYRFLDDGMDSLYRSEERWSKIVAYGSFFAIFVACLGLFGLAGITAMRRRKEVGIRKVLGASVTGVVLLLSRDFSKLVLGGVLLALPVSYLVMGQWLQNFAYRIEPGLGTFLLAGGIALAVALLTVSRQALKAALANPADSLRTE